MNIFVLDLDPALAAQYHCDSHVVKMVLETAQILSTVNWMYGLPAPYKSTHKNHPCVVWAAKTADNYKWLVALGRELAKEYTHRYGKKHKSAAVIDELWCPPSLMPAGELTPFAQAMPESLMGDDPVEAYRTYYNVNKQRLAVWTGREQPPFYKKGE